MRQNRTLRNSISRRISFIFGFMVTSILLFFSIIFIGNQISTVNTQLNQKMEATRGTGLGLAISKKL